MLPTVRRTTGGADLSGPYIPAVRDALLESLFASQSHLLVMPIHDVFGWRDRINEPAKIDDQNWTFQLPWASDRLTEMPDAAERQTFLRALSEKYGRV